MFAHSASSFFRPLIDFSYHLLVAKCIYALCRDVSSHNQNPDWYQVQDKQWPLKESGVSYLAYLDLKLSIILLVFRNMILAAYVLQA